MRTEMNFPGLERTGLVLLNDIALKEIMPKLPLQKNLTRLLNGQNISRMASRARMNKSTLHGYLNGIEPRALQGLNRLAESVD